MVTDEIGEDGDDDVIPVGRVATAIKLGAEGDGSAKGNPKKS